MSINVFSTKTLIEETVFTSPAGNRTAILRGQLSPPHRLLLGIPIKIAIIENRKSAGDDGKKEKAGALFFSLPGLPTTQRGPCGGESTVILGSHVEL